MKVEHNGRTYEKVTPDGWKSRRVTVSADEGARLDEAAEKGTITDDDGRALPEAVVRRIRARLLGTYDHLPEARTIGEQLRDHRARGGTRFLIPELMPWGTYPSLGGQPGAGKTNLVADFAASLLVPDRRFLDHFEPATLTEAERQMAFLIINTEMAPDSMVDVLAQAGIAEDDHLVVEHVEELGGPEMFDLTNPAMFDAWAERLIWCEECDGSDEEPPVVVIADNLTAVLQAVHKPLEAYGELHGAFVRLMATIDCPNGLTVVHNTLEGGHAMGGVTGQNRQDGRWSYWTANPDDPLAARYFKVVPRYPGCPVPATRVVLGEDGRLRMGERAKSSESATAPAVDAKARVLERLREADDWLWTRDACGSGDEYGADREALDALLEDGRVVSEKVQRGRSRGVRWRTSPPAGARAVEE